MTHKIKILTVKDWLIYKQIRLELLKNNPESFHSKYEDNLNQTDDYWKNKIQNPNNIIFVTFDNSIPIGIVRITQNDPDFPDDYAYLGSLYIKKEYRKQGIASELIKEAEEYSKSTLHLKGVYLIVNSEIVNAVKLYESLKYTVEREKLEEGQKDLIMVKEF